MATLLLVHGTGVREPGYSKFVESIRARVSTFSDVVVSPCYWGGQHGAELHNGGASIPDYDSARGLEPTEEELMAALWLMLADDPLFELRMLESERGGAITGPPTPISPAEQLKRDVRSLKPQEELRAALAQAGIEPWLAASCQTVSGSSPLDLAARNAGRDVPRLRVPAARAVVAVALVDARRDGLIQEPTVPQLEALVTLVSDGFGGAVRGPIDWLKRKLGGIALGIATNKLVRKRGAFSDAASPGAGDILLYQLRGGDIRGFIHTQIEGAEAPVVILAHSLGGVASVDLLVKMNLGDKVQALITVGSQSPYFYEIDALYSLRYTEPLPDHFPKTWINFYDRRDILSYIGEGVFPNRVRDIEVKSKQPFPISHSAYWSQDVLWDEIQKELARA